MSASAAVRNRTPSYTARAEAEERDGRFPIALLCPDCTELLPSPDGEEVRESRCRRCGASWPRVGRISVASRTDDYWGEIPREEMRELIALAESEGWRTALRKTLEPAHRELRWYASSEARADFRFLLPVGPQSVVLDAGAGWGTLSIPLARAARWVVALEGVHERIRFIEIRARQERISNLQLVQGDAFQPPLPRASFDVVVANGLLEWVGLRRRQLDPRAAQLEFLRRVRELLRPDGALYIGIENRFGIGQWRGDVDHTGFRFTSLMPRRLADAYVKLRQGRGHGLDYRAHELPAGYRTYTYSPGGYVSLLEEAGFTRVAAWTSIEGYNDPHRLVPLDANGAARFFHQRLNRPRSALSRAARTVGREAWWPVELALRRFLAPSLLIVARKPEGEDA